MKSAPKQSAGTFKASRPGISDDQSSWYGNRKLWTAVVCFGLAAGITVLTRPAPIRVNASIIAIASSNDVPAVQAAIESDPSQLRAVDIDGNTSLHIAAMGGYGEMVDALIAAGADVNLPNRNGWTALATALLSTEKNQVQIVKALIAAGAKTDVAVSTGETLAELARSLPGVNQEVIALIDSTGPAVAEGPSSGTASRAAVASAGGANERR